MTVSAHHGNDVKIQFIKIDGFIKLINPQEDSMMAYALVDGL
jgi:hypothetical protein